MIVTRGVKEKGMKELVLFYSFSGNSKKYAVNCARKPGRDLCEVQTAKKLGKFYCYAVACPISMAGGTIPITPISVELTGYDLVHVYAPIWAGHMAPPMHTALSALPKGTRVSLHMVSAGGKSSKASIKKMVQKMGLEIASYEDIKSIEFPI
jgi:hypothetical protein